MAPQLSDFQAFEFSVNFLLCTIQRKALQTLFEVFLVLIALW